MELGEPLSFSDVSQETELYDNWLFSSTTRYRYINMYETEKSSQAISWFDRLDSPCICVATNEMCNNELMLYQLPEQAKGEEDMLSKDREMKIVAASHCDHATNRLSLAPENFQDKMIVGRTDLGSSNIYLHRIPTKIEDNSIADINLVDTLSMYNSGQMPSTPPAFLFLNHCHVAASQTVENVKLCDVQTHQITNYLKPLEYNLTHTPILDIISIEPECSNHQLFVCTKQGEIITVDSRNQHTSVAYKRAEKDYSPRLVWRMSYWKDYQFLLCDDANRLSIVDMRNTAAAIQTVSCLVEAPPWTGGRLNSLYFSISQHENHLSISGKDNKLRIYDLTEISASTSLLKPVFTHDGHLPTWDCADTPITTCHCWRTKTPGLLSATNSAQIHTWMFKL